MTQKPLETTEHAEHKEELLNAKGAKHAKGLEPRMDTNGHEEELLTSEGCLCASAPLREYQFLQAHM